MSGVEQGGINSGDLYKCYNNEQFVTAQSSNQGVDIGSLVVSAAGQADDALLSANDIFNLQNLLYLTMEYCKKYNVLLCPEKTKLIGIASNKNKLILDYQKAINPVNLNGIKIDFVQSAEHVGVIRSVDGNLPNLLNRIQSHQKALGAVLCVGMAKGHYGNPAAGLRVEKLYGCPVLMSGLASLYLKKAEITILETHYKSTLERIQKLFSKTPRSVVFFLAGSLPAIAILHLRQLTLFIMICHFHDDPLNIHAKNIFKGRGQPKSWFSQITILSETYGLPQPLQLLLNPPPKNAIKLHLKKKVVDFWESKLRSEASCLSSLTYFRPGFMSLSRPHPIWTTSRNSAYETQKACVQAKMLSGRHRTEELARFWSSNKEGFCLATECHETVENLEHILVKCPALEENRQRVRSVLLAKAASSPFLHQMLISL